MASHCKASPRPAPGQHGYVEWLSFPTMPWSNNNKTKQTQFVFACYPSSPLPSLYTALSCYGLVCLSRREYSQFLKERKKTKLKTKLENEWGLYSVAAP